MNKHQRNSIHRVLVHIFTAALLAAGIAGIVGIAMDGVVSKFDLFCILNLATGLIRLSMAYRKRKPGAQRRRRKPIIIERLRYPNG
jgi:hypothetical protein